MKRIEVDLILQAGALHPPLIKDTYRRGMLNLLRRRYPTMCIVAVVWLEDCCMMSNQADTVRVVQWLVSGKLELPGWLLTVAAVGTTSCAVDISQQNELERMTGDWQMGRFAWRLGAVAPLNEPVQMRGCQGLRTIQDEAIKAEIARQIQPV